MSNWKTIIQFLATAIVTAILTACFWNWHEQDNIDSFTNKSEWSILQGIEYKYRESPITDMEFRTINDHRLVCLPATNGGRVWILMDAAGSTRYKQMGGDKNFTITKQQLEQIKSRGKPTSTVERVLESHLYPKKIDAEPALGP